MTEFPTRFDTLDAPNVLLLLGAPATPVSQDTQIG